MSTGTTASPSTDAHVRRPIVVDERTKRPRVLPADLLPLEGSGLAPWLVLAVLGACVVAEVGLRLHASAADLPVTVALNAHRTGLLGALTTGLYRYLEPPFAAALAVAVVSALAWRRGLRRPPSSRWAARSSSTASTTRATSSRRSCGSRRPRRSSGWSPSGSPGGFPR